MFSYVLTGFSHKIEGKKLGCIPSSSLLWLPFTFFISLPRDLSVWPQSISLLYNIFVRYAPHIWRSCCFLLAIRWCLCREATVYDVSMTLTFGLCWTATISVNKNYRWKLKRFNKTHRNITAVLGLSFNNGNRHVTRVWSGVSAWLALCPFTHPTDCLYSTQSMQSREPADIHCNTVLSCTAQQSYACIASV